jgi:hypothetical protein
LDTKKCLIEQSGASEYSGTLLPVAALIFPEILKLKPISLFDVEI